MAEKKPLNLSVPAELLDEFYEVCGHYGHAKQKGQVLSAAILMFLRADPHEQGRCLEEIVSAEITSGVDQMLEKARKEQGLRVAMREASEQAQAHDRTGSSQAASDAAGSGGLADDTGPADSTASPPSEAGGAGGQKRAAKDARDAKRGRSHLPDPNDPSGSG
jgi:hypothetical protein